MQYIFTYFFISKYDRTRKIGSQAFYKFTLTHIVKYIITKLINIIVYIKVKEIEKFFKLDLKMV